MKKFLKPIYLQALIVYLIYTLLGKYLLITGILADNSTFAYFIQMALSAAFAAIFLYLFSHEDFFRFAKVIEKKESEKEKKYIKKYLHLGKHLAVLVIGILAGPLFAALSARFLIPHSPYRYLLVIIASSVSSLIWLGFLRGTVGQLPFLNII